MKEVLVVCFMERTKHLLGMTE